MSGYLGRLLQASVRSEPRLYPMAGSIYGEHAGEMEHPLGSGVGAPHGTALDQFESAEVAASPMPAHRTSEPMASAEHLGPMRTRLESQRLNPPASTRAMHADPGAAHPPDPIRATTIADEPPAPARPTRGHLDPAADTTPARGRPHHPGDQRLEAATPRADAVTGEPFTSFISVARDQSVPSAPIRPVTDNAAPRFVAEPRLLPPDRHQYPAARPRMEQPEVQVHIGRIEVLAVPPQAPAAPAPRREQATRLADYLAQRNGSGR